MKYLIKSLFLFLLLLDIFIFTINAQENKLNSFKISPIYKGLTTSLKIYALDKNNKILKNFNEKVIFKNIYIYNLKKSTIKTQNQGEISQIIEEISARNKIKFENGIALIKKAQIRDKNVIAFYKNKKIPVKIEFLKIKFISSPLPKYVPVKIHIKATNEKGEVIENFNKKVKIEGLFIYKKVKRQKKIKDKELIFEEEIIDNKPVTIDFINGEAWINKAEIKELNKIKIYYENEEYKLQISLYNPLWTLVPPLLAIILAMITKEVLISLFIGIWAGVFVLSGYNIFGSFIQVMDTYIIDTLSNREYVFVIVFSLTIGGMIGIIANSGSMHDLVDKISKWAKTPRSGMISTWLMGIIIFFDDYANTLLVGNSMRPITDKLKISREKLAYIVDSTAAPVTSLAFISTWIGTEIGYIAACLSYYGQENRAFEYFIVSIPYRFYSIFTIIFVFLISYMLRDFGPMLKAERRARTTGKVLDDNAIPLTSDEITSLEPPKGKKGKWYNALIPILIVIFITLFGLYYSGVKNLGDNYKNAGLREIIQNADSFSVLLWAATWGSVIAGILVISHKILTLSQTLAAWVKGVKSMILAMLVLILAWTLKDLCGSMFTNRYIFYSTKDLLSVKLLPFISFIISAIVAFATGTSWGTMGLLFPLLLPLSIELSVQQMHLSIGPSNYILLGTIGSILAGSSFGDHCSPISDTTVMSSMASACDHLDHVKTQIGYALTTAIVGCLIGYIPVGFGLSPWISLILGTIILYLIVRYYGEKVE